MLWNYILKIKIDDNIIYKRDLYEKEIYIEKKENELCAINNRNCEMKVKDLGLIP